MADRNPIWKPEADKTYHIVLGKNFSGTSKAGEKYEAFEITVDGSAFVWFMFEHGAAEQLKSFKPGSQLNVRLAYHGKLKDWTINPDIFDGQGNAAQAPRKPQTPEEYAEAVKDIGGRYRACLAMAREIATDHNLAVEPFPPNSPDPNPFAFKAEDVRNIAATIFIQANK